MKKMFNRIEEFIMDSDELYDLKLWLERVFKIRTCWYMFKKYEDDPELARPVMCGKCGGEFFDGSESVYSEERYKVNYCPFCGVKLIFREKK